MFIPCVRVQLSCGHRCKQVCHPGVCEEKCQQRVKLRCPCKRIKKVHRHAHHTHITRTKRSQKKRCEMKIKFNQLLQRLRPHYQGHLSGPIKLQQPQSDVSSPLTSVTNMSSNVNRNFVETCYNRCYIGLYLIKQSECVN